LARKTEWIDKDVDLKLLADSVYNFFKNDHFHEIKIDKDDSGSWYEIHARKTGVWRTVTSQRKSIIIVIRGNPNRFSVVLTTGEWGKNVAVASVLTGGWGLIGLGLSVKFKNKLWDFVITSIDSLTNSFSKYSPENNPIDILKKRLAEGDITPEQFAKSIKHLQ